MITTFVLILHLMGGTEAYDDTVSRQECHEFAEALKEGGSIELEGEGVVIVETATCIEAGSNTQALLLKKVATRSDA